MGMTFSKNVGRTFPQNVQICPRSIKNLIKLFESSPDPVYSIYFIYFMLYPIYPIYYILYIIHIISIFIYFYIFWGGPARKLIN